MEKNRGVIRELLKYEFELGHTAKEAMDNINRAKGHGIVAKRTAYEWFSKFKNNQMEIADKKRAGRPREIDRAAVVNTVERPERTFGQRKPCCACGGIDVDRFFGSFWSRERRLSLVFIVSNSTVSAAPFEIDEFQ